MIDLFVPGRLCLFGEHSDWAGGYRKIDRSLTPGYCLTAGTDQGIHARIRRVKNHLQARTVLPDGSSAEPLDIVMEKSSLKERASSGGFWSYAAGVASEVLADHKVGGLELSIYHMDLPIKKGLSSSAAICVLLARSWNQLYNLVSF